MADPLFPLLPAEKLNLQVVDGIFCVADSSVDAGSAESRTDMDMPIPTMKEFFADLDTLIAYESEGPLKTFAFKRLSFLESLFDMHLTLNEVEEQAICKVRR